MGSRDKQGSHLGVWLQQLISRSCHLEEKEQKRKPKCGEENSALSETPRGNAQSVGGHVSGVPWNWSLEEGLRDLDELSRDQQTMPSRLAACFLQIKYYWHTVKTFVAILSMALAHNASRVEY